MKILFLAASAATIAMLGACSGAPAGLDPSAPSLSTTSTTTTTTTTTTDSTSSTCTTSTTSDTSDTSTTTSTSTEVSASGTYAVAYGGELFIVGCSDSP